MGSNSKLLREKRFLEIDIENLVDEVETLGRSECKAIRTNLKVLLMHLLKYQYQPEKRWNSWNYAIIEHRNHFKKEKMLAYQTLTLNETTKS